LEQKVLKNKKKLQCFFQHIKDIIYFIPNFKI
jgi:hypothetical protein